MYGGSNSKSTKLQLHIVHYFWHRGAKKETYQVETVCQPWPWQGPDSLHFEGLWFEQGVV